LIDPNVIRSSVPNWTGGGVGCLVGCLEQGTINGCYVQGGSVKGEYAVGGLVGSNGECVTGLWESVNCWGGTFLDAGWDFVGETANGTEDIWWINEGKDYPRLWWEVIPEN